MARTNVVINDRLMRQAMRATGLRTKRAVIEAGLRLLVEIQAQTSVRNLRGMIRWEGDLDTMRAGRVSN